MGTDPARSPVGLTEDEAQRRLAADGRNETRPDRAGPLWRALRDQLTDAVIVVLLIAAGLTAAVGDVPDTAVIVAVIVLNTSLGVAQAVRSEHALAALATLVAPRATVTRSGHTREVTAAEIVRGDVVRLAAGDVVPAELELLDGTGLQVDESMLTGESLPVAKPVGARLSAGTVVTRGTGWATVTATGAATAVGAIGRLLAPGAGTPLQRQLASLGHRLAIGAAVVAAVVAGLELANGETGEQAAVLAISLAVAAIPESLPAVVSIGLALAARRMSAQGVLVRHLPAVEALGSVTVLAMDKTGTLTEGRMSVAGWWTPAGTPTAARRLLTAAVLCNDARPPHGAVGLTQDDPLETALLAAAQADGMDIDATRAGWPRLAGEPFDAASGRMATTHRGPDGPVVEIVKGAPEIVLAGLTTDAGARARAEADRLAAAGARVLAVTSRLDGDPEVLGLVALSDRPRPDAAGMVASFRAAGVRPVMITGDHPGTARAVAAAVGIRDDDRRPAVFARVRPDGKRAIVTELQNAGEVVAMTGDGVNDAPALRAADVGVSMGPRATEVARQAADIVLTADDLATMAVGIAEGRRNYDNLRRFLHYALGGGVAEVFVMIAGVGVGFAVPLQAGQLLWTNLLTHGLPGVAMGNEPAARDVLVRAPRSPRSALLDRAIAVRVAVLGACIAAVTLAAGIWARHDDRPGQSVMFVTLTLAQLLVALALRPRGRRGAPNRLLLGSVALNVLLVLAAVEWEPLRTLLRTKPVSPVELGVCLGLAFIPALVAAGQRRRGRPEARSGPATGCD